MESAHQPINSDQQLIAEQGEGQQVNDQHKAETVQLDPRETYIIQTHAAVMKTAKQHLSEEQLKEIQAARISLHRFVKNGGDAARVALMLFGLEYDNSVPPYGETFCPMLPVEWQEALESWKESYIDPAIL